MTLAAGVRLGPYEIQAALGAGGMGEVYRARDPRLGRDIAVKVLPAALSADPERLRRFEQEARAAAALNHPNILAVYDIGLDEGAPFIVMELLEGETLRERVTGSSLPVRRAVEYATQIARGLAAAHEKGIVHRDLKPENVFVTADGRVKILDFGLAKLTEAAPALAGVSQLPTLSPPTTPGVVLGTVGYMAPEQVRGEPADHRADIFALGTILYELLAGRRAFHAATTAETMTAILKEDPPELPVERLPPALARIVHRCLEKHPSARFQTATDLAFALEALSVSGTSSEAVATARAAVRIAGRERVAWAVAAVTVVAAVATLWLRAPDRALAPIVTRFELVTPPTDSATSLALSPDGRQLAYVATTEGQSRLWVRSLDNTAARVLPGTEGGTFPFWAPDASAIGFFADRKLKRIDLAGGMPQVLADAQNGRGGTWSADGVILFTPGNAPSAPESVLMRVSAAGGTPVPVTRLAAGEGSHRWPQFLPDGQRFLFFNALGRPDIQGVYLGSLDGGEPRRLLASETPAVFVPPDRLLLVRGDVLMTVSFDSDEGMTTGELTPLAQPVGRDDGVLASAFSASPGVLAFRASGGSQRRQLIWIDRAGRLLSAIGSPDENNLSAAAVDPTGQRIAVTRTVLGNFDVWLVDATRGVQTRFTFDPSLEGTAIWSPDGRRVVFYSTRTGRTSLFEKSASGAGDEHLVIDDAGTPLSWSSDGQFLLYSRNDPKTGADLWILPMTGERKPRVMVQTAMDQPGGEFSPDGRWLAYESNESGRFEVYVQPFAETGGKWQVSIAGGTQPRWSRDGRELYYVAPDARLMAVPIKTSADGKTVDLGVPTPLFRTRLASGAGQLLGVPRYAVSRDGRFLMNIAVEDTVPSPITIVLNWEAGLGR